MEKENWDLFDKNGKFVRIFTRGHGMIPKGLHHKTVEVIPCDEKGRLLITQRSLRKTRGAGLWEFPAGSVKSRETPAAAATRELLEETGLKAKRTVLLHIVADKEFERHIYMAIIDDLSVARISCPPEEIMDYKIVHFGQWLELTTTDRYDAFRSKYYTPKMIAYLQNECRKTESAAPGADSSPKKELVMTTSLKAAKASGKKKLVRYRDIKLDAIEESQL